MLNKEWFEKQYADPGKGDGWGVRWRGYHMVRYDYCLEFIKKYISDSEGEILEIGCGLGYFTLQFLNEFPHSKVFGIDISHNAIKEISRSIPYGSFEQSALPDIPFDDDSFSGILAMEVIYYLDNEKREESIKNIQRKLKKSAWFLFTTAIDNGKSYFTCEKAVDLIGKYFEIRAIDYNWAKLYRLLECFLLKAIRLETTIQMSDWNDYLKDGEVSKKIMYKITRNKISRTLFMFLFQPFCAVVKIILRIKFIPRFGNEIGKRFLPDSSKTNIMILAVKK